MEHTIIIDEIFNRLNDRFLELNQPYIKTVSGIDFTILDPQPEMIRIEDIAHALSKLCRYGGHCKEFYSVARHSIIMSYLVKPGFELEALLHDATEAFIGDCVTPLKKILPEFNVIEDNLYKIIANKYGLSYPMSEEVKNIDAKMIGYEWDYFMENRPNEKLSDFYELHFINANIEDTEKHFKSRFNELFENLI